MYILAFSGLNFAWPFSLSISFWPGHFYFSVYLCTGHFLSVFISVLDIFFLGYCWPGHFLSIFAFGPGHVLSYLLSSKQVPLTR